MAVPIVAGLLAQATIQVLTKPWAWAFFGTWLLAARFDVGLFANELRDTIFSMWWLLILTISLMIVRQYLILRSKRRGSEGG